MSDFMRRCICCGESYFQRAPKDSLCDKCDGSYWRQEENGFKFEKVDSILYDWKPTDAYRKAKGLK